MHMFSSIFVKLSMLVTVLCVLNSSHAIPMDQYLKLRENTINDEESSFFGGNLVLQGDEIAANRCLMSAKLREIDKGYENLSRYFPSRNFLNVRQDVEQSKVFEIIRLMPKGAVLHTHAQSTCSFNFIFQYLANMQNLYVCSENSTVRFRFFETPNKDCNWKAMKELQENDREIITKIKKDISLPNERSAPGYNSDLVWEKFGELFKIFDGLITFRPAFEKYLHCAMQELYDDNIMYVEFRGPFYLDGIYELNGTVYHPFDAFRMFKNIVDKFAESHPGFFGTKFIYRLNRQLNHTEFDKEVNIYRDIKRNFPNFISGFDITYHEDKGHPNIYFAEKLLELSHETSFYFHAGETNWFGHPVDENLFDAVLFNSKRIGHGFALLKHPALMKMVKEKNIAIEVNPISNQVLGYVTDLRNHPAAYYFADNFSVIVSNDNPSYWGSSGLSYDFYEAFVGIMSRKSDLRALKQLAINSVAYSALTSDDKQNAFRIWEESWFKFVKILAHEYNCEENLNDHEDVMLHSRSPQPASIMSEKRNFLSFIPSFSQQIFIPSIFISLFCIVFLALITR